MEMSASPRGLTQPLTGLGSSTGFLGSRPSPARRRWPSSCSSHALRHGSGTSAGEQRGAKCTTDQPVSASGLTKLAYAQVNPRIVVSAPNKVFPLNAGPVLVGDRVHDLLHRVFALVSADGGVRPSTRRSPADTSLRYGLRSVTGPSQRIRTHQPAITLQVHSITL